MTLCICHDTAREQRGPHIIGYRGSSGCRVLIVFHKPIMSGGRAYVVTI